MSRPKIHLIDSDEPLKEGTDLLAMCLTLVPRGSFAFTWDEELNPDEIKFGLSVCCECREIKIEKRYVYGVITGQASLDQRERAE